MAYSIYTLSDPRNNMIRYVGISENPYRRYGNHLSLAISETTPKNSWIAELMDNELLPTLTIIERGLDRSNALDREDSWIKFYTKQYGPLLNVSERGKSYAEYDPIRPAQVHIRDIRIAKMLSQRDLGDLAKVSASVISRIEHGGYVPPFEVIERIAIALDVEVSEIYNNDKLA
jgi:DNA-binding XRE family transcriptional regulator